MLVTLVTAVPLGVAAGIYLEEYGRKKNWFTRFIEINIANLAGVPSIIYGLMALGLFVYQFGLGQSILAAGLTLGMLVLPIVIVATREALRAIPQNIREAAVRPRRHAMADRPRSLLPYSTGGIATGVIIAMSRAIGETAPLVTIGALTFIAFLPPPPVSGDFPFVSFEWLKSPFTVLPIQMFNWVSRPTADFHVNAAATGLVLIVMTLGMNAFAICPPLPHPQTHQMVTVTAPIPGTPTLAPTSWTKKSPVLPPRPSRATLSFYYGTIRALQGCLARLSRAPRDGADRPERLRQDHVSALLQPHARPVSRQSLRRRNHPAARRDQSPQPES